MLKTIVRNLCMQVKNARLPQYRLVSTETELPPQPKSVNLAKLVGTIASDVYSTPKSDSFFLKTVHEDNSYDIHKIIVSPQTLSHFPHKLSTGQRLLVIGRMRAEKFERDDGRTGTAIRVMTRQLYLADPDTAPNAHPAADSSESKVDHIYTQDQNRVELNCKICFDILNHAKYSVVSVAYHYLQKDGECTDFFTGFVYDEKLLEFVRNRLQRLDRVLIRGMLKHKPVSDNTGKKRYNSYIDVTSITKLVPMREADELQKKSVIN